LEARQTPIKSDTQKFLEKLTYEELCQLQKIAEKKESGEEPTQGESAFLDELEAKYGLSKRLSKRITALEARQAFSDALDDRWPPMDCYPARRLARYTACFEGRPWVCTGNPERKAQRDVKLARYQKYFDNLGAGVAAPENGMEVEGLVPISFSVDGGRR
jgi:hypothetical protein